MLKYLYLSKYMINTNMYSLFEIIISSISIIKKKKHTEFYLMFSYLL